MRFVTVLARLLFFTPFWESFWDCVVSAFGIVFGAGCKEQSFVARMGFGLASGDQTCCLSPWAVGIATLNVSYPQHSSNWGQEFASAFQGSGQGQGVWASCPSRFTLNEGLAAA